MSTDRKRPSTSGHVFRKIHKGSGASKLIGGILLKSDTGTGRTAQTLSTMIDQFNLDLCFTCGTCAHRWTPPGAELVATYGADTPLQDVKPACPACGGLAASSHPVARS
jgi:hypothetical protein